MASAVVVAACSSDSGTTDAPSPKRQDGPTLHHVLATGQSNGIGFAAHPPLTTSQPFSNVMFDTGVITATDCDDDGCRSRPDPKSFVPLVEGDSYPPLVSSPSETMSSSFANLVSELAGDRYDVLVSVHARSGNIYLCLRKGGCSEQDGQGYVKSYDDAIQSVKDAKRLAADAGRPYVVNAVTTIHGESDHYDNFASGYGDHLVEWQRDYETDVRAITGQKESIPLFVSQMANWNDVERSQIPIQQLLAHTRAPGKVILIGATYFLPFAADCIHYTNEGERTLGKYFAKAYARTVIEGKPWEPLRPQSITLNGDTVDVKFLVPKGPLTIDTGAVGDPGNFGFEFDDGTETPPSITDVSVPAFDTVRLQLSAPPAGDARRVRYAMLATPKTCPGPRSGPRGNLRDSDGDLPNWAVSFDLPVE